MKMCRSINWSWFLSVVLVGFCAVGCRSVGYRTGDPTAEKLRNAGEQLTSESRALDATFASLDRLVNSPVADLKRPFKAYKKSLRHLEESVSDTDKAIAKLRQESNAYLNAWNSELSAMNYEVIRSQSEARKSAVSNQLEAVCHRYEETQNVVRPMINYFGDIERALGTDLTAEGLAAAREIVHRAGENTEKIQMALTQLREEFSVSGNRLSSSIPLQPEVESQKPEAPQKEAGLR